MSLTTWLSLLCVLLHVSACAAMKYRINEAIPAISSEEGSEIMIAETMYSLQDAPMGTTPPFISFSGLRNVAGIKIGWTSDGKKLETSPCDEDADVHASVDTLIRVNSTEVFSVFIVNCNDVPVDIHNALVTFRNPYGFLPAKLYTYLPFYEALLIIYSIVAAVWLALNAYFWRDVVMLQTLISGAFVMYMIEVGVLYGYYNDMNSSGWPGSQIAPLLFTALRKTASRLLVALVCFGYGLIKVSLGDEKVRLVVFGVLYFVCELIYEYSFHSSQTNRGMGMFIVTLPLAALDAYWYWWTCVSLYNVMAALRARKQELKLEVYNQFFCVIIASVISSLAFLIYAAVNRDVWKSLWFLERGFWELLYTAVLFVIMGLWRPNQNSRRYAYSSLSSRNARVFVELGHGVPHQGGTSGYESGPEPVFEIDDADADDEADEDMHQEQRQMMGLPPAKLV